MSEELKPCPFCGCADAELDSPYQENWAVECNNCSSMGSVTKNFDGGKSAIIKWNVRAKPTFTKEDVDKAAEAMEAHGVYDSGYGEVYPSDGWEGLAKAALNAVGRVKE